MNKKFKRILMLSILSSLVACEGIQENTSGDSGINSTISSPSISLNDNQVLVKFDANGGIFPTGNTTFETNVEIGNYLEEPQAPTKKDYLFVGWSVVKDNNSFIWDFNNTIENDMTLYALWEEDSAFVDQYIRAKDFTHWDSHEIYNVDDTLIIKYNHTQVDLNNGKQYDLNKNITISKDYIIYWYEDSNLSSIIASQAAYLAYGDNIFFATILNKNNQIVYSYAINIYVKHNYICTFYEYQPNYALGKQMGTYAEIQVLEGDEVSPCEGPKNGYKFINWVTLSNGIYQEYNFDTPVLSDMTFYATYESVVINLNIDGLSDVVFEPYLTSKLDIPSSKDENYFSGYWHGEIQYFDAKGVALKPVPYNHLRDLTAKFSKVIPEPYVSFKEVDGGGYSVKLIEMPPYNTIRIPSTYMGKPVVEIEDSAFYGCNTVTSIIIPNSITNIGNSAFSNCSSLDKVYYEGTIEDWCKISFNNCYSNPMSYANHFYMLNENNEYAEVTEIIIPNSITIIGSFQFYGCNTVTSVIIPNSVTSIGDFAFYGCSSLTSIKIPNSVASIGVGAFSGCSSLPSIDIPNTITIREALNAEVGTEVTVRGVVVQLVCASSTSTTPGGFYLADGDYAVYVYGANTAKAVQLGDEVIIKGNTAAFPTSLTNTTQIATPTLVATIARGVDINAMQWDTSKLEKKTVEEVATTPVEDTSLTAKVVYMENIRLNKYVPSYTTMSIYDWKDTPNCSTDPKVSLYSGQGDAGMPEYDHLNDYLDKKINVVFAINGASSKGKWRGCIIAVWLAE